MQKNKTVIVVQISDFSLGRALYISKAFSILGYRTIVITNKPVYSNAVRYPSEIKRKITIHEVALPRLSYSNLFTRLILYIYFSIISVIYMARYPYVDIVYSRGPHPFTDISCFLYKILFNRKVKIISGITDLWPETLKFVKMNNMVKYIFLFSGHLLNSILFRTTDIVVTLNDVMGKIIKRKTKKPVFIVYGVVDTEIFRPFKKEVAFNKIPQELKEQIKGKFIVLYSGILGSFQNPNVVIDIAEVMKSYKNIFFLLIGTGPLRNQLEKRIKKLNLKNIVVYGPVSHDLMPYIYNIADIALVLLPSVSEEEKRFFAITLPKKFIEYSACGLPILCITPVCAASNLCQKWKAGFFIPPEDLNRVPKLIKLLSENKELRNTLSKNSRAMAEALFTIENAANVLKEIIDNYVK